MKQTICLNIVASSINSAYYNDKRLGYNQKTKEWIAEVCRQLEGPKNSAAIKALRESFDANKHCFHVLIEYGTPAFFNKQGTISSKSADVGNITKTLLDVLYTPAFHGSGTHKCENINVDDKHIAALYTKKVPSSEHYFKIIIHIKKLPKTDCP